MVKARMGARLKVAVGGKLLPKASQDSPTSANHYVDPELVALTNEYKAFTKKLLGTIKHVKAHHLALQTVADTRLDVAIDIAELSNGTPLYHSVGKSDIPTTRAAAAATPTSTKEEGVDVSSSTGSTHPEDATGHAEDDGATPQHPTTPSSSSNLQTEDPSYLVIHQESAQQSKRHYSAYATRVLEYLVQWERVVTTRISADLKTAEGLRVELVHYASKVETLRQHVDAAVAKNKEPKEELKDKWQRNMEKLRETREQQEQFGQDLCLLLDEVVHRSWRDLQPLVMEMIRLDLGETTQQQTIFQRLTDVMAQVQNIGQHNEVNTPRLKDLETKTPMELSTCPGANVQYAETGVAPLEQQKRQQQQQQKRLQPQYESEEQDAENAEEEETAVAEREVLNQEEEGPGGDRDIDLGVEEKDEPEVQVVESVSETPHLYVACATGDDDWLRYFLRSNLSAVDEKDDHGMLPLGIAAHSGHAECVRLLLEHGAIINAKDSTGSSPLHHAAAQGFEECVEVLLEYNADADALDEEGFTPFDVATENGHTQVAKLLVEHNKAAVDQDIPGKWRPIHLAAQKGHHDTLSSLIQKGVNVNKMEGETFSPLHLAAANGHDACVHLLLEHGARVDDMDQSGTTALQKATDQCHLGCIRILLGHKADPNSMDLDGYTPLIATALSGSVDCMRVLLEHGANVDQANPVGWTPLHLSADYGFEDCLLLLLEHKANIQLTNQDGWTALHKAAERGQVGCLSILLTHGANIDAANADGFTALHSAAFNGHANCVQQLLERNANLDRQDHNGCTPLYWAASEGRYECTKLLVQGGADSSLASREGNTPADIAWTNGHKQIEEALNN